MSKSNEGVNEMIDREIKNGKMYISRADFKKVSKDSNIQPENLTFIITPTTSICGNIQVVARVLEVAIHKIHELKFPLERVIHGIGYAPLPPIAKDFITAKGTMY